MKGFKLIETGDGSHTIAKEDDEVTYHSHHGALTESLHVFIEKGLKTFSGKDQHLNVLEVGLGTGLNALLTQLNAHHAKSITYHAIEPYPLPGEIISELNYADILREKYGVDKERCIDLLNGIHQWRHNQKFFPIEHFGMTVWEETIQNWTPSEKYHVVYYDAFAPDDQQEMWEWEAFRKLFEAMKSGGVLVTFSAKGAFKRMLNEIGFQVENTEGPPGGKKEMTRAFAPEG